MQFFKRSGLPVDLLKKIWVMSSSNGETLNREEFYVALKLISFAQNNIEVSKEAITRGQQSPLPKFSGKAQDEVAKQEDVYRMHPEQEKKYLAYMKDLDPQNTNYVRVAPFDS